MSQPLLKQVALQAIAAGMSYREQRDLNDRRYLIEQLIANRMNQCRTAKAIGMHRNTLSREMERLKITIQLVRAEMIPVPNKKAAGKVDRRDSSLTAII